MTPSFNTPVLLLIFNRPDVTQKVFDQIKVIKPKHLYVAADGPRPNREDDIIKCKQTRQIIDQIDWPCELKTLFRDENLGCGFAVCSAISWFFDQVEAGIVLEDDCQPDISFFPYCSELLEKYKDEETIYLISGTNVQNGIKRGEASYYFSNYTITWGWASWRRAWSHFNYDIPEFNESINAGDLDHVFLTKSEKSYWRKKLLEAELGKKTIWDYQWYFAVWKNKGIGITSNVNLITNIGFRNNAVHDFLKDSIREPTRTYPISFPLVHPKIKVDRNADHFTFINAYSHSFARLFRLLKENGLIAFVRYTILKAR